MTILLCALLAHQSTAVYWNPKEIQLPTDLERVQFEVYAPSQESGFTLQRARLVWVPKLESWPDLPGRQAVRLTMKDQDGRVLEVLENPSVDASNSYSNVMNLLGQGYLAISLQEGMSIVCVERGDTCVGLVSVDLHTQALHRVAKDLRLLRK